MPKRKRKTPGHPEHLFLGAICVCISATLFYGFVHAERSLSWETSLSAGPCSMVDDAYDDVFFAQLPVDTWHDEYHATVASAVEWYLRPPGSGAYDCSDETLNADDEESQEFVALARSLPPWRDHPDTPLTRNEFVPVMRRYLEVYECALIERLHYVASDTLIDYSSGLRPEPPDGIYGHDDFNTDIGDRKPMILRELGIARPALERTLSYAQNAMQFDTLSRELDCFMRASLDLRNGLALATEASMCLPARTWDTRDALRGFEL